MWNKINNITNRYNLNLSILKEELNKDNIHINLPNPKGNMIEYDMHEYSMLKNNSKNIRTFHSNKNNLVLTLYDNHCQFFSLAEKYSIKYQNNNYILKEYKKKKKNI